MHGIISFDEGGLSFHSTGQGETMTYNRMEANRLPASIVVSVAMPPCR